MRQVLQRLDTGEVLLEDVPAPTPGRRHIVVEASRSLVSAGTERMLLEFGRASWLDKARQQPDKVRQVLAKVATDGLGPTLDAVRSKLSDPIPVGYSQAGRVVAVGADVTRFRVGDRVATNGPHAEVVRVPTTLAARIPDGVQDEQACFTPVAAIGLQGIRLAGPTLGETVVVFGLGLIGLLTVQMLRASGCRVIGLDRDPGRLQLAESFGAIAIEPGVEPVRSVMALTDNVGADAVLLTLASSANEPINQAAAMCRKRGRVVLVGVTGLDISRDEFFKKELQFSVSCSYGPGRYDPEHEEEARDYPLPYVRWTEGRNFEAVLALMSAGQLDPTPLISHRVPIDSVGRAYDIIGGAEASLGVVLEYRGEGPAHPATVVRKAPADRQPGEMVAGVIGAGNFARRTLLPELRKAGVSLRTIVSSNGTTAGVVGREFGFEVSSSETAVVLNDPSINTVFALTRHDSHARLVLEALAAGKHVFVEKPLALTEGQLEQLERAMAETDRLVMVGFNRRFAPITQEMRNRIALRSGPVSLSMLVNAGAVPAGHWTRHPTVGGGRFVGEGCHFVDLARTLVGQPIVGVTAMGAREASGALVDDIVFAVLTFADGSIASVQYTSQGAPDFPKEEVRAFFDGGVLVNENWRRLRIFGAGAGRWGLKRRLDKGHAGEIRAWVDAVRRGGPAPIPAAELIEVSRWTLEAARRASGPA